MKDRFNSLSPFNQALSLIIFGVVMYAFLSIGLSLIIDQLKPTMQTLPFNQRIKAFPLEYMTVFFLPTQLGLMLTPGIIYYWLTKKNRSITKEKSITFTFWGVLVFASVFLLLPLFSEINAELLKVLKLLEGEVAKKEASDQLLTQLIGEYGSPTFYFAVLTIGLLTGIAEELAFRRFLFHHFMSHTNRLTLSLISSSLIFALLHFNYLQFIPLFIFGMTLAMMYYASGSLLPGILAHTINNTLNVYWIATDNHPYWLEELSIETTIPSIILLTGLLIFYFKRT